MLRSAPTANRPVASDSPPNAAAKRTTWRARGSPRGRSFDGLAIPRRRDIGTDASFGGGARGLVGLASSSCIGTRSRLGRAVMRAERLLCASHCVPEGIIASCWTLSGMKGYVTVWTTVVQGRGRSYREVPSGARTATRAPAATHCEPL